MRNVGLWLLLSVAMCHASAPPNLLLILTDDQDLELGSLQYLPKLDYYLIKQGVFFERFYVNTAL